MTTDPHTLAAAYALDALDADERAHFEAHLATCEDCRREVAELADVASTLAESSSTTPPADLKASVMSKLDEIAQDLPAQGAAASSLPDALPVDLAERRRRKLSIPTMLAAAAAIVIVAVGAVVISGNRGNSDFDDVIAASDAVVTPLDGGSGSVEVAYSADLDRVAVRGAGLADLAPDLRYALWAIADGTPVPAGLFEPGDGSVEFVTDLVDVTAQAWGVTIEPAAGSDQPTTEIIYFAEV